MKKNYLILFVLCTGYLDLKAQYEHLLHKTYVQRFPDTYLMYFGKMADPDVDSSEVFNEINIIAKMAVENNNEDLLFETRLLEAHYYYYRLLPLAEVKLEALLEEARKKNITWLVGRVENVLALYYLDLKQYEKSFEHFNQMYNVIKDLSPEEFPVMQGSLFQFGNSLYSFMDYRSAIFMFKEALRDTLPRPWNHYYLTSYNSIGLCYRALNNLDSSSYYFRFLYDKAIRENNVAWIGISSGNLGENYFLQKDYEKARPLLQKDADISIASNDDPGLTANALMILADISFEQKDLETAENQLMEARKYAYRSGQYKRLRMLYPLLSKYYIHKRNTTLASRFLDSAFIVCDSLDKEFNTLFMTRARQKVELEQHRNTLREFNNQKEIKTLQRNGLFAIVVLIMIITLFIYDRQKRRYKEKNLQLKWAREELGQAAKELTSFTRNIAEKNKLIEDLQRQVGDPGSETIRQLQRSTILTEEQWSGFKNLFDKVYTGYLQRLKEKMPGLTPAETRFVALTKLKLSNREMASMLGVGTDAIRQYRSRLRKKLQLTEEDHIEEMIEKI